MSHSISPTSKVSLVPLHKLFYFLYQSFSLCSFQLKKNFFWCVPFLKSLLNLLQYCFCFMIWFFCLWSIRALSFLTRDRTCNPCFGTWSLNRWTIREVPMLFPALKITSIKGSAFSDRSIHQGSVKDSDPSWRFFYLLHPTLNISNWKSHWYWNQRVTT